VVVEDLLTGIISAYIVSLLAVAYWAAWLTPTRRRRQQFFGLSRRQRSLHIRCSFLRIQSGGAHGNEVLRVGYTGPAIIRSEYLGAQALKGSLERVRRGNGTGIAMDRFRGVSIDIDASSHVVEATKGGEGTLVLMGSRIYNGLTKKYFDDNPATLFEWARAKNRERTLTPRNRPDKNLPFRRPPRVGEDPTTIQCSQLAAIERHWDAEHARWVFLLVGVGALATTGAAKYLAENWRLIERKIRKHELEAEFGLLLDFENCRADLMLEEDLSDIPEPTVLRVADRKNYSQPTDGRLK
jgi:hypothetical protein